MDQRQWRWPRYQHARAAMNGAWKRQQSGATGARQASRAQVRPGPRSQRTRRAKQRTYAAWPGPGAG
eukprot:9660901-Alexandrium_andersonii.AAC.1